MTLDSKAQVRYHYYTDYKSIGAGHHMALLALRVPSPQCKLCNILKHIGYGIQSNVDRPLHELSLAS